MPLDRPWRELDRADRDCVWRGEGLTTLDAFFRKSDEPFPSLVVTDVDRKAFLAYGVSGTPTFVLVDAEGIVSSYSVGYSPAKGLGVEGWTWSGRPGASDGGSE